MNSFIFFLITRIVYDYFIIFITEIDIEYLFNNRRNILGIRKQAIQEITIQVFILLKNKLRRKERDEDIAFLSTMQWGVKGR